MRTFCGMALVLGLLFSFRSASGQISLISIAIIPSSQTTAVGSMVDISLVISGLGDFVPPSLGTFDLDIIFDPAILAFRSAVFGDQLDLAGRGSITEVIPGIMNVNLFELSLDDPAELDALQPGSFTVVTLTFETLTSGTSALEVLINALGDVNGDPLEAETGSGSITTSLVQSQITSQFEHGCVVNADATLWCWGEASYGWLGNGTIAPPQFTSIQAQLTDVAHVDAGVHQTCAVKHDGTAWCWGEGSNYRLGNGNTNSQSTPRQVATLTDVAEIATNKAFSCARQHDGTAWCWGDGAHGQLGDGGRRTQRLPIQVTQATGLTFLTQLAVGERHACAVQDDGTAWCWGANGFGRLGDGTTTQRNVPTQVVGLTDVHQVVAGAHHSCALTTDGTVWCWGEDARGEVGDGPAATTPKLTPVQVSGLANVTYLSLQVWHTCAVKDDGSVWCWGGNSTGQLGDGTATDRHAPVQVVGLTDVAQVSAGYYASCALKHDGPAWCWGAGGSGRLGNGRTTGSLTPVQVRNIP